MIDSSVSCITERLVLIVAIVGFPSLAVGPLLDAGDDVVNSKEHAS